MPKPLRVRHVRIARLVDELLNRHRVKRPPVSITKIAQGEGLQISEERLEDDLSGFVLKTPHHWVIGVNKWHSETRQRFTIAHECGHALLHDFDDVHIDRSFRLRSTLSSKALDIEEIEANTFAASILMPEKMLIEQIKREGIDVEDERQIASLAEEYEVSRQAMAIRVVNLFSRFFGDWAVRAGGAR